MHKDFRFELKSLSAEGSFEGLAAVYGNIDLGGDVIEPGAFAKTLLDKNGEVPILFAHDTHEPIGIGRLTDTREGLAVTGELVLESPTASKAYALLKKGVLKGLSIGYDDVKSKVVDGVRRLSELKLWEVSLVVFPMNPLATVTGVKTVEDVGAELRGFRETIGACRKHFRR